MNPALNPNLTPAPMQTPMQTPMPEAAAGALPPGGLPASREWPDLPALPWERLAPICQRHGVVRLALFGSRLKGTARADSDVDLLVAFAPGRTPGLFEMAGIEIELSEALGLKVDLRTAAELSRYFRDEVQRAARVVYAS